MSIRERGRRLIERLCIAIVWRLPRHLAYWAVIRVWANGTTGAYGNTIASELTCVDALERWR